MRASNVSSPARTGTLSAIYADGETIDALERRMRSKGYLEAADMNRTFLLLRANDLVFNSLRSGWLMGDDTELSTLPIRVGPAYSFVLTHFLSLTVIMLVDLARVRSGKSMLLSGEAPSAT